MFNKFAFWCSSATNMVALIVTVSENPSRHVPEIIDVWLLSDRCQCISELALSNTFCWIITQRNLEICTRLVVGLQLWLKAIYLNANMKTCTFCIITSLLLNFQNIGHNRTNLKYLDNFGVDKMPLKDL